MPHLLALIETIESLHNYMLFASNADTMGIVAKTGLKTNASREMAH
jgi:hypothetical protein